MSRGDALPPTPAPPDPDADRRWADLGEQGFGGALSDPREDDGGTRGGEGELSGGIGVCGHCGSRLGTHTSSNAAKIKYFYYVCPKRVSNRDNGTCPNTRHFRAEALELLIKDALQDAFHPEMWGAYVDALCDRRLADLRKIHRTDHEETKKKLAGRIASLKTKASRARELFIDGDLSRPDCEEKKATLQDEIGVVQEEMLRVDDLDDEIGRVEDLRSTLMAIESPLSGHYAFIPSDDYDIDPTHNEDSVKYGFGYGSKGLAAKRRQEFYRQVKMRVEVGDEVEISLGVDRISVREDIRASDNTRNPKGTP
jgi:Recombinase zinc beta ribbon domain